MLCTFFLSPTVTSAYERTIEKGRTVSIHYILRVDGKVLESTVGKAPLTYHQGDGKILPALAKALEGLKEGDHKRVVLPPQKAYGLNDPKQYRLVKKSSFPIDLKLLPGMVVDIKSPQGDVLPAIVWEVHKDDVLLNFNHPLAGKTLVFDVTVVKIR